MSKKIIKFLFLRFIPSSKKIALNEAKRIADYLYENYNLHHQNFIIEQIQIELEVKRSKEEEELDNKIKELCKKKQEIDRFLIKT